MRFLRILIIPILLAACTSTTDKYLTYQGTIVEENEGQYSRLEGNNTVFEVYHFSRSRNPLSQMAWEGSALFIEISEEIIQEGKTIILPSKNIRLHLFESFHYRNPAIRKLFGQIKVLKVNPKHIVLQLNISTSDLKHKFTKWQLNDTITFERTDLKDMNN